jgi:hypothetical protein
MTKVVRWCLTVGIILLAASALTQAQEAQVAIVGDGIVRAGENLDLTVTLDKAPNFDGGVVNVAFLLRGGSRNVMLNGQSPTKSGERTYHLTVHTIPTTLGGVYVRLEVQFNDGSNWVNLPHKDDVSFRVIANTGLIYPTSAEVQVNPSQIQFLRIAATGLQNRLQALKASVAGEEEPLTKAAIGTLRNTLEAELEALKETEEKFRTLGNKSQDKSQEEAAQVFFDDLRTGYTETLRDLSIKRRASSVPRIVAASQTRELGGGKYPLTAQVVFRVFELNELAYDLVADSESMVFDLEVNSNPEGAAVSYRRRGDSYKQHQNPTNSIIKSLPLAIWTVRLQKQGYRDQKIDFNPFVERNRTVTVNLEK